MAYTLQDVSRYWGDEVAVGGVSLAGLHQMARQRAVARQRWPEAGEGSGGHGEGEVVEEGLPPLTHLRRSAVAVAVHHRLPDWITRPRLVAADIGSGSAPLSSVALPAVVSSNLRAMGYTSLFPVQVEVIPELLAGLSLPPRDVCVCAPTGCGKTLCYVVPMVTALLNCVVCQVRGIVVVPSRTLARQVASVFSQVSAHTGVQCGVICGEMSVEKEAALLRDPNSYPASSQVDIAIATPGRLAEHLQRGSFPSLQCLRFLVIDEADKLLSQQIYSWLAWILQGVTPSSSDLLSTWLSGRSDITHLLPSPPCPFPSLSHPVAAVRTCASHLLSTEQHIQKVLLSATMTQDPEALAALQLHRPLLFSVGVPQAGRETMTLAPPPFLHESVVTCSASLKPLVLLYLLDRQVKGVALLYDDAERWGRLQVVLGHFNWFNVAVVTGDVAVRDRKRVLGQFARGEVQVLVCSDALARGMDMPACSCVVNYDPPLIYRTYVHRVGRTARAGCAGRALSLLAREQVSAFHHMLRVAKRPKMEELQVDHELLQPLLRQYEQALAVLRRTVRT